MGDDKIALGDITPEDQERLRQEQEAARERKEADRRDAENAAIEKDAGRMYEQAVVMGDDVERSIPPVRSENDGPERPVER
jgi:hypothetical protein